MLRTVDCPIDVMSFVSDQAAGGPGCAHSHGNI